MKRAVTAKEIIGKVRNTVLFDHAPAVLGEDDFESMEQIAWKNGIIAPNGPRKVRWDWFILLLVFYTSFAVPFQLAFYTFADPNKEPVGFAFDVLVDVFFIIDVLVSWRTTYYHEGILVVDKALVHKEYLRTWFPVDVLASFPFEYLAMLGELNGHHTSQAWSLPSMIKVLRIFRLGNKINRLSSSKAFRILQFTFMLIMVAHWYACLWYGIGFGLAEEPADGRIDDLPGKEGTSWVYRYDLQNENLGMQYAAALYWSVTTLMKSPWFHPNSPSEFAAATIMIIIGCVLFASFLGNVTAVITAANAKSGRYRGQIDALKSFCHSQGISSKMSAKLLIYQDALWVETSGGTDRNAMLNTIPRHLLPYVLIGHIYRPLMDACPFLHDCSAWGCVEFLRALKVQVCERGDTLIRSGTLIASAYILQRGEIKIHYFEDVEKETAEIYVQGGRIGSKQKKPDNVKQTNVKDAMRGRTDKFGTLIGFTDPFKPNTPREYTVDALSRCSLLMITRAELKSMLTSFEDDQPHVLKAIEIANEQHRVAGTKKSQRQSLRTNKNCIAQTLADDSMSTSTSSPTATAAGQLTPGNGSPDSKTDVPKCDCRVTGSAVTTAHVPLNTPAVPQAAQGGGGLFGLLTPNTQLQNVANQVEALRNDFDTLREQLKSQNEFMARQSEVMDKQLKMMQHFFGDQRMTV